MLLSRLVLVIDNEIHIFTPWCCKISTQK